MKKLIIALLCLLVHFADAQNGKKNAPNNPSDTTINGTQFVWYNDGYVVKDQKIVFLNLGTPNALKITRDSLLNLVKSKFAIKLGIKGAKNYESIQTVKTCPCDEKLVLLSYPGIESVEIVPDPDGSSSGGNSLNESDAFDSNYIKQPSTQTIGENFNMPFKEKTVNANPLRIAFIDTGIATTDLNINRSSLFSRVRPRESNSEEPLATNFTGRSFDGNIEDNSSNNHGTNVAHILMKALGGQNVTITPLKVFNNDHGVLFDALCAMLYAKKTKNNIINCSWGHGGVENPVFRDIINILDEAKIMVVCSAGNKGRELGKDKFSHYPAMFSAKYNNVITVSIANKNNPTRNCCNYSSSYVSYDYKGDDNCEVAVPYSRKKYKYGSSYATAWVTGALAKRYFSFGNNPSNGERKQRFLNTLNTNRPNPNE